MVAKGGTGFSGRAAQVGLARVGAVVRAATLDDTRRHARDLAATVDTLLKAESLKPTELTGVIVRETVATFESSVPSLTL